MRKKLITALVVAAILLAAAVGVIMFLESNPGETPTPGVETTAPAGDNTKPSDAATEPSEPAETTEPVEETVGISLPTEDPDDVFPEETFGEEDEVPPITVDPSAPPATEDRDSNELPEDEF